MPVCLSAALKQAGSQVYLSARLLESGDGEAIKAFPAGSKVALVGRGQPDAIETPKDSNSRSRTQIVSEGCRFWVWDHNSTNETFVNGRRTEKRVLRDRDLVGIGGELVVFQGTEVSMHKKQHCGRFPKWPLPFFFLLLVLGMGNSRAQEGRGLALVIKGIAQYEDSALFEHAIATLEAAVKSGLDYRDSTRAYFYLGFSHFKLGQQDEGSKFFRMIVQRNPDAKLPAGTEEFADSFERIRQQVKEGISVPVEQPPPQPAETLQTRKAQPHPESVYVRYPVYVGPRLGNYLVGASAGAVLGLASYVASVLFDNLAADKVKAYSMASDSAYAAELKGKASQYHSLGDVFYYSSYPLIAVGFYVGLKASEKVFAGKVSFLRDDSPTKVYCSLDKHFNLSLEVRRSIW